MNPGFITTLQFLLKNGGFSFPRDLNNQETLLSHTRYLEPDALTKTSFSRQDAVASIVGLATLDSSRTPMDPVRLSRDGRDMDPSAEMAPYQLTSHLKVTDGFRVFHRAFCEHLVLDSMAWRAENDAKGIARDEPSLVHSRLCVADTLGVAMATAAMLGHDDSVALIARHSPLSMRVNMDISILGPFGKMWQNHTGQFVEGKREPNTKLDAPLVNPFCCALQFSSSQSMEAMLRAEFPVNMPLGIDRKNPNKQAIFDISSLSKVILPTSTPAVYEAMIRRRLDMASPKDAKELMSNAIEIMSDKFAHVKRQSYSYVPALIKAGAFDANPVAALKAACEYGQPLLVERVLSTVNWDKHASSFGTDASPLSLAVAGGFRSADKQVFDTCASLIVRAAIKDGTTDMVLLTYTSSSFVNPVKKTQEPMGMMIRTGAMNTLRAVLDAGFNAIKAPSRDFVPIVEQAKRMDNGTEELIIAHAAQKKAVDVMAKLDIGAPEKSGSFAP